MGDITIFDDLSDGIDRILLHETTRFSMTSDSVVSFTPEFGRFLNQHKSWSISLSYHYSCSMAPDVSMPEVHVSSEHCGFFILPPFDYYLDMLVIKGIDSEEIRSWSNCELEAPMKSIIIPKNRMVISTDGFLTHIIDDSLIEIASNLESFQGFVTAWNGRDMEMYIRADFLEESDAAFFKLSL